MTQPAATSEQVATRIRLVLEEIAAALVSADLARLLAAQAELELAVAAPIDPESLRGNGDALRREVERARRTLARCRQLGQMLDDVARITAEAQGRTGGYGPRERTAAVEAGRAYETRG